MVWAMFGQGQGNNKNSLGPNTNLQLKFAIEIRSIKCLGTISIMNLGLGMTLGVVFGVRMRSGRGNLGVYTMTFCPTGPFKLSSILGVSVGPIYIYIYIYIAED